MINLISRIIATFFGVGYMPKAPGTFATVLALPLYLMLRRLPVVMYLIVVVKLIIIGIVTSDKMEKQWGKDPKRVVIDEVCGILVALMARPSGYKEIALGTVLFRFFDILKPPPVGTIDKKVKGGIGIMADDIAAGIMSALVLLLVKKKGWLR